jgi:phosphohistidine phosphatase
MRRLILLRHGKTEAVSATGGDFDRALTERGRRDSALIGRVLAEAGLKADLALVSPARRTEQTWDEVAPAFRSARAQFVRALYLASPEQIADVVATAGEDLSLVVIGHNPGLHEYALQLAGARAGARALAEFPTAAAAVFSLERGGAELERVLLPRDHGGGSA